MAKSYVPVPDHPRFPLWLKILPGCKMPGLSKREQWRILTRLRTLFRADRNWIKAREKRARAFARLLELTGSFAGNLIDQQLRKLVSVHEERRLLTAKELSEVFEPNVLADAVSEELELTIRIPVKPGFNQQEIIEQLTRYLIDTETKSFRGWVVPIAEGQEPIKEVIDHRRLRENCEKAGIRFDPRMIVEVSVYPTVISNPKYVPW